MTSLIKYFNCGHVYKNNSDILDFKVTKFADLENIIIPFDPFWGRFLPSGGNFKKHRILGIKSKDFED